MEKKKLNAMMCAYWHSTVVDLDQEMPLVSREVQYARAHVPN